jgi:hypothetical protein
VSREPIAKPKRKRLDRARFAGLPLAPKVRIVDEAVLEEARARGYCEWCGRAGRMQASHAVSVGAGGDDSRVNVTSNCIDCHAGHHAGQEPTAHQLLEVARLREASRRGDWHARIVGSRLDLPRQQSLQP